jgi:hypothetical protein
MRGAWTGCPHPLDRHDSAPGFSGAYPDVSAGHGAKSEPVSMLFLPWGGGVHDNLLPASLRVVRA